MPKTETFKTDRPGVRWYDTAAGKRYMCFWRDQHGKQKQADGFPTKKAAADHKRAMEGARVEGRDTTVSKVTFGEFYADWYEAHRHAIKPGTREQYESWFKNHLEPALGHRRLVEIRKSHIEALKAKLIADGLGQRSIRGIKAHASQVIKAAIAERMPGLLHNPCEDVKAPRRTKKARTHAYTVEQVNKLLSVAQGADKLNIRALAFGGLRPGELGALQRRDFDPKTGTVHIHASLVDVGGHLYRNEETKTYAERIIKMQSDVTADLAERAKTMLPDAPLYTARRGGLFRANIFGRSLKQYVAKYNAGVEAEAAKAGRKVNPDELLPTWLTPYTLRHTCATILARQNVPVHVAAAFMGHDPAEFLRTYADVFTVDLDAAAAAIETARKDAIVDKTPYGIVRSGHTNGPFGSVSN